MHFTENSTPLEWDALWAVMQQNPHPWCETTEHMYYEMLGAVPPKDMGAGGFLVGEPQYHNANGEAVYACFITNQGKPERFQARYMTQAEFNKWKIIRA